MACLPHSQWGILAQLGFKEEKNRLVFSVMKRQQDLIIRTRLN